MTAPKNSTQLYAIRDALVDGAVKLLDDATEDLSRGALRDPRGHATLAAARRELAFTVDTIAGRAVEAEHKAVARRARSATDA